LFAGSEAFPDDQWSCALALHDRRFDGIDEGNVDGVELLLKKWNGLTGS
jgi:hypothetical protein